MFCFWEKSSFSGKNTVNIDDIIYHSEVYPIFWIIKSYSRMSMTLLFLIPTTADQCLNGSVNVSCLSHSTTLKMLFYKLLVIPKSNRAVHNEDIKNIKYLGGLVILIVYDGYCTTYLRIHSTLSHLMWNINSFFSFDCTEWANPTTLRDCPKRFHRLQQGKVRKRW